MGHGSSSATFDLPRGHRSERAPILAATLIFAALSLFCAVRSQGFVAADACTHYLYARYAFEEPVNLVDVWARPFCTAIYAIPAHLGGRLAVRCTSLLVALGCAAVAYGIARGQRLRWPGLAFVFTLGQPLLFVYSFGEMTELPFALLLGAAFVAYQGRQWFWMALLAGLMPAARPEGFGFVLLAGLALVVHRRLRWLPVLALPLLAWDLGGWVITQRQSHWWHWLIDAWPWGASSLYGRGNILSFAAMLPVIVSPLLLPAMLLGTWRSMRRGATSSEENGHLTLCRLLTAAIPLFVLAVHSLIRAFGKFGSYGEPRYLLTVAPFWAILSARGWEWVFVRLKWSHPYGWAGTAALVPILLNVIHPIVPIGLEADWAAASRFADFYRSSPLSRDYPHVVAAHPGIYYFLDRNPTGSHRAVGFTQGFIARRPPGTILLWDPTFANQNAASESTATLKAIEDAGWIEDAQIDSILNGGPAAGLQDTTVWHAFRAAR